jgi:hypothetical protein
MKISVGSDVTVTTFSDLTEVNWLITCSVLVLTTMYAWVTVANALVVTEYETVVGVERETVFVKVCVVYEIPVITVELRLVVDELKVESVLDVLDVINCSTFCADAPFPAMANRVTRAIRTVKANWFRFKPFHIHPITSS